MRDPFSPGPPDPLDPLGLNSVSPPFPPTPPEILAEEAVNALLGLWPGDYRLCDRNGEPWHMRPREMNEADCLEYLECRFGTLFARLIDESGYFRTH